MRHLARGVEHALDVWFSGLNCEHFSGSLLCLQPELDPLKAAPSAENNVVTLYLVGEPDCRRAHNASVLHSAFELFAVDEGVCGFDRCKIVRHRDVVEIVGRLVHRLSRHALCFLDRVPV
jgi:hypothetical protein